MNAVSDIEPATNLGLCCSHHRLVEGVAKKQGLGNMTYPPTSHILSYWTYIHHTHLVQLQYISLLSMST